MSAALTWQPEFLSFLTLWGGLRRLIGVVTHSSEGSQVIDFEHASDSIRAKLRRAQNHLNHLDAAMTAFNEPSAYSLWPQGDTQSRQRVFTVHFSKPFPLEWSVLLSEAIHHLRSALDHTVYVLSYERIGSDPEETSGFPIYDNPQKFRDNGQAKIKRMGDAPRKLIQSVQPHISNGQLAANLASLEKLWNYDKHRVSRFFGIIIDQESASQVRFVPEPLGIDWGFGVLHDGAVALTLTFDQAPLNVEMNPQPDCYIAFSDPTEEPSSTNHGTLWALYDSIAGFVSLLLSMRDDQDRPLF